MEHMKLSTSRDFRINPVVLERVVEGGESSGDDNSDDDADDDTRREDESHGNQEEQVNFSACVYCIVSDSFVAL